MIGLGTYSFFWQHSGLVAEPLDLEGMLGKTHELGASVFQICDFPAIEALDDAALRRLADTARDLGITLELGTRGVSAAHLTNYLRLATALDASLVRSMKNTIHEQPSIAEAEASIGEVIPAFEEAGVTIALETYEQMPTSDLVSLVESVGSTSLGICLDPANTVAALENPLDVIRMTAPYVANIHVKDFAFTRRGGWVGFTLEGVELGTGLLDYGFLVETVKPDERGINQIIEHWLPLDESIEETVRVENLWNLNNLTYLNNLRSTQS